jgi:hypothetical protein
LVLSNTAFVLFNTNLILFEAGFCFT